MKNLINPTKSAALCACLMLAKASATENKTNSEITFKDTFSTSIYTSGEYFSGPWSPIVVAIPNANLTAEFGRNFSLSAAASPIIANWPNANQFEIIPSTLTIGMNIKTSVGDFGARVGTWSASGGWAIGTKWDMSSPLTAALHSTGDAKLNQAAAAEWSNKNTGTDAMVGYAEMNGNTGFEFNGKQPALVASVEQKFGNFRTKVFALSEQDSTPRVNFYAGYNLNNKIEATANFLRIGQSDAGLESALKYKFANNFGVQTTAIGQKKGIRGFWLGGLFPHGGQANIGLIKNDPRESKSALRGFNPALGVGWSGTFHAKTK